MTKSTARSAFFLFLWIPLHMSWAQSVRNPVIQLPSLDAVLGAKVLYALPDLMHPGIILKNNDTVDISLLVAMTPQNRGSIEYVAKRPDNYRHSQISVGIKSHRQLGDYLVCLSDPVIGEDILLWKKAGAAYRLLAIYPNEVGVSEVYTPDFHTVSADTFSVGAIVCEEGGFFGSYNYYVVADDSIRVVKELFANGSCPFLDDTGDLVKGATCASYLTVLYDEHGARTELPIYYECRDPKGNDIYDPTAGDSLSLFKMYWQGIGPLIRRMKASHQRLKIGSNGFQYKEGYTYIAIEYEGQWYWALTGEMEIGRGKQNSPGSQTKVRQKPKPH